MFKRVLAMALCLGLFPGLVLAQSPEVPSPAKLRPSLPAFPTSGSALLQTADWQNEYNAAIARKAAAKRKMLIGVGVMGAGLAITLLAPEPSVNDCVQDLLNGDQCGKGWTAMMKLGGVTQIVGSGVVGWGFFQYHEANGDLRALERRRPTSNLSGASVPITENQTLRFSLGQAKSLTYRLSW